MYYTVNEFKVKLGVKPGPQFMVPIHSYLLYEIP